MSDFARNVEHAVTDRRPIQHPERLAGSIEAPRRRRITAGRMFGIAIEITAGLVALVAALALVA